MNKDIFTISELNHSDIWYGLAVIFQIKDILNFEFAAVYP